MVILKVSVTPASKPLSVVKSLSLIAQAIPRLTKAQASPLTTSPSLPQAQESTATSTLTAAISLSVMTPYSKPITTLTSMVSRKIVTPAVTTKAQVPLLVVMPIPPVVEASPSVPAKPKAMPTVTAPLMPTATSMLAEPLPLTLAETSTSKAGSLTQVAPKALSAVMST